MAKHKTATLEGALLDAAVAKAEGLPVHPGPGRYMVAAPIDHRWAHQFAFSTDWDDAGPLIERERITIVASLGFDMKGELEWSASVGPFSHYIDEPLPFLDAFYGSRDNAAASGPTPLIAAMRAYVASKFGEDVDL